MESQDNVEQYINDFQKEKDDVSKPSELRYKMSHIPNKLWIEDKIRVSGALAK